LIVYLYILLFIFLLQSHMVSLSLPCYQTTAVPVPCSVLLSGVTALDLQAGRTTRTSYQTTSTMAVSSLCCQNTTLAQYTSIITYREEIRFDLGDSARYSKSVL